MSWHGLHIIGRVLITGLPPPYHGGGLIPSRFTLIMIRIVGNFDHGYDTLCHFCDSWVTKVYSETVSTCVVMLLVLFHYLSWQGRFPVTQRSETIRYSPGYIIGRPQIPQNRGQSGHNKANETGKVVSACAGVLSNPGNETVTGVKVPDTRGNCPWCYAKSSYWYAKSPHCAIW